MIAAKNGKPIWIQQIIITMIFIFDWGLLFLQTNVIMEAVQDRGIIEARDICIKHYGIGSLVNSSNSFFNSTIGSLMCPAYFDSIMCWPPTPANTTATQPCPKYFVGFLENASKICTENGTWYVNSDSIYWTNYTNCIQSDETLVEVPFEGSLNYSSSIIYQNIVPAIKIIARSGYSLSLVTLIIAFIIMFSIKKLHCPRNKLHMHLFASFIFRALITLLKDVLFVDGVGMKPDIRHLNNQMYFYENKESGNWGCKLYMSLFQFFITANYSWILMEGLYLHNLIFRALFADSNRSITSYIILGWGLPLIIINAWIISRIFVENTFCWTTHTTNVFLIIRISTIVSIVVNMILFVRIACVIYSKLQAPIYEEAKRYQKWARSTLVLAPLFGIHYALFLGMSSSMNKNVIVEVIWLIIDQLFGSFQGFFVAVLYCFCNSEVRTELKPHVHAFLLYIATNSFLKYCFPCRERYLRSARGRTSVCTTMSCSSLFNNGVNHRNSRTKWEIMPRNKNDRSSKEQHVCRPNIRSWHETPCKWTKCTATGCPKMDKQFRFSSNGNIAVEKVSDYTEIKCKSESQLIGESICMLPRNGP